MGQWIALPLSIRCWTSAANNSALLDFAHNEKELASGLDVKNFNAAVYLMMIRWAIDCAQKVLPHQHKNNRT